VSVRSWLFCEKPNASVNRQQRAQHVVVRLNAELGG